MATSAKRIGPDAVTIHEVGKFALSCCAPKGMSREVVASRVSAELGHRYRIADRAGRNNPRECDCDATRQHWLLRC